MGTFWTEAYISYRKVGGYILTLLGFLLGIWSVFVAGPPVPQVDLRWVLAVFIIAYIVSATCIDMAARALKAGDSEAAVLLTRNDGPELLVLLSPSRAFGNNAVVSFYQRADEFEIFIGTGRVDTIRKDGKIQVSVLDKAGKDDVWEKIRSTDKAMLPSLLVKPSFPFEALTSRVR
jgi:hypothetical protein